MKKLTQIRNAVGDVLEETEFFTKVYRKSVKKIQEISGDAVTIQVNSTEVTSVTAGYLREFSGSLVVTIYSTLDENYLDDAQQTIVDAIDSTLGGSVLYANFAGSVSDYGSEESPVISRELTYSMRFEA